MWKKKLYWIRVRSNSSFHVCPRQYFQEMIKTKSSCVSVDRVMFCWPIREGLRYHKTQKLRKIEHNHWNNLAPILLRPLQKKKLQYFKEYVEHHIECTYFLAFSNHIFQPPSTVPLLAIYSIFVWYLMWKKAKLCSKNFQTGPSLSSRQALGWHGRREVVWWNWLGGNGWGFEGKGGISSENGHLHFPPTFTAISSRFDCSFIFSSRERCFPLK